MIEFIILSYFAIGGCVTGVLVYSSDLEDVFYCAVLGLLWLPILIAKNLR
jgi:hypothetical protein